MPHPTKQLDFWHGWANINPKRCPCRGFGWLMSDWNSYHVCGYHGKGVPHPEEEADFDSESHLLKMLRQAWVRFRDLSGKPSWYRLARAQRRAIDSGDFSGQWLDQVRVASEAAFVSAEDDS